MLWMRCFNETCAKWYSYNSMWPVTAPPLARGLKSRTSTFITTWTRLVPEGALELQPPLSSIEASKTVCQNSENPSGTILSSFLHVYTWEGATRMDHTPQSLLYLTWNFMRSIWKLDIMKVGRLTLKLSSWCKSRRIGVERITSAQHEVNQYHLVNCKSLLYSWFHGNCLGFLFLFARTSTLDFNPILTTRAESSHRNLSWCCLWKGIYYHVSISIAAQWRLHIHTCQ